MESMRAAIADGAFAAAQAAFFARYRPVGAPAEADECDQTVQ
jgi:hypothetical protein